MHPADPTELSSGRKTVILILVYAATVFYGLDSTVVATLATPVGNGFGQLNRVAWLNSAYLLSIACCTPLYGKLSDIMGRRIAVVLGLGLFTLGSALCGLSHSMNMLIFARFVQGTGGGGAGMMGSIIISDIVSLRTRGLLNGIGSVCWSIGAGFGGIYGGLVTDRLGWRWAFLLQVPVLALVMCLLAINVTYAVPGQTGSLKAFGQRIDWRGSLLLVTWISSLVVAVAFKTNEDLVFSHPLVYGPSLLCLAGLVLFVIVELRWATEPVIDLALLKDKGRIALANSISLTGSLTIALSLFFPMFLQIVRENSASFAGLHVVPNTFAAALGGVLSGLYIRMQGKFYPVLVVLGICQALPCFVLSRFNNKTWEGWTWVVLTPQRFASAGFSSALIIALLNSVGKTGIAQVTSIRFLFQSCGQVIGMAASSAIQQFVLSAELKSRITTGDASAVIAAVRGNTTAILDLPPTLQAASVSSYASSLQAVFLLNGVLGLGALVSVIWVTRSPLSEKVEDLEAEYELVRADDADDDDDGYVRSS